MTYAVKEIFPTLQGEGAQAGTRAVFLRMAGCNLWSGREEDRATARCTFCDTDFVGMDGPGGGRFADADALADAVAAAWGPSPDHRLVVVTGGEPLLQLDAPLIDALHARHFRIAVESNGTIAAPDGIDWLCISPKAGNPLAQASGDELKLVWPQSGLDPHALPTGFAHRFVQPKDVADPAEREANIQACLAFVHAHPGWRLSVQTHKALNIP